MTSRADKSRLRAESLARRAEVGSESRSALSAVLATTGVDLARRVAAGKPIAVSAFLPIRGEPDTTPLLAALSGAGLRIALPATPPRGRPLAFRAWRLGAPLVAGRFGTSEPAAEAGEVEPDLLFVPLAAFDARGFRLGYGAGYYDGALRRLRGAKPVVAVGVAFAAQQVAAVPTEAHDERLDAVLTERGLVPFGSPPCASSSSAT